MHAREPASPLGTAMIFELFEDTVKMVFIVWLVFIQAHVMST